MRSQLKHICAAWFALPVFLVSTSEAKPVEFSEGFPVTKRSEIYPMSQLKVGQKGIGYTVFQGAKAEPFNVEILGLMKGMLGAGKDVILAKLTGKKIEFTGVISGMSGSPVYIDGKLLGAVSYRFGRFSKESIAGITPIDSMLEIYSDSVSPRSTSSKKAGKVKRTRTPEAPSLASVMPKFPKGTDELRPIETPVLLGGFPPRLHQELKQELAAVGLKASFGAVSNAQQSYQSPRKTGRLQPNRSSMAAGVSAAPIAPASPISAVLMRGDMNMSAVGTVTYVEDGKVLGFGHPFFGEGHVRFPMATSAILNTLASEAGSYKQASPALEVGTITHDRLTAIAGNFTEIAPMLPVKIHVRRSDEPKKKKPASFLVEVVKHEQWTPTLTRIAVDSAISNRLGFELGGTVDMKMRLQVGDRSLAIEDTYSGPAPTSLGRLIAADVGSVTSLIVNNAFVAVDISSIEVEVTVTPAVEISWLQSLTPSTSVVAPGEKISVAAVLRDYRGNEERLEIPVQIPKTAEKSVSLLVGGSVELDRRDSKARGGPQPTSLDELLGLLATRRPGRGLYGRLYMESDGLRRNSEVLSSLPVSQRTILSAGINAGSVKTEEAMGPAIEIGGNNVVVGQLSLKLRVSQ